MEGTGTDLAGDAIHYAGGSGGYWVNVNGARTDPGRNGWSHGAPYWRDGGWRNAQGGVTFKHADGTWDNGPGVGKKKPYHDTFGTGPGVPVTPWHSIATDTSVLPRGTSVYVPSLATTPAHGCFRAEDTGGAIIGNHIDVLVPASASLGTLPEQGLLTALAPGQACPPGVRRPRPRRRAPALHVGGARVALRGRPHRRARRGRPRARGLPVRLRRRRPPRLRRPRERSRADLRRRRLLGERPRPAHRPDAVGRLDARAAVLARRRLAQREGRADVAPQERHLDARPRRAQAPLPRPLPPREPGRAHRLARRRRTVGRWRRPGRG